MKLLFLAAFVFLAGTGISPGAEVFTTTGSAGEKVYTDKPASNAERVRLEINEPPADTTDDDEKSLSEMTPCERTRLVVSKYEAAEMLARKNEDGTTRILDEDEKRLMIERARADETRLCKDRGDSDG